MGWNLARIFDAEIGISQEAQIPCTIDKYCGPEATADAPL